VLYTYTSCSQFDVDYYISACLWVTFFFKVKCCDSLMLLWLMKYSKSFRISF